MKNLWIVFGFLIIAALSSGCMPSDRLPAPESDSSQQFSMGSEIPVDDSVYEIYGEIYADIENLTEVQAKGSMGGYAFGGYGSVGGSYAMWQEGKGFVRVLVESVNPSNDMAIPGHVIIVKTTDQKIMALLPGDKVTLKCRAQYEAIAAVRDEETFDAKKLETWELDYCRMKTPDIGVPK